MFVFLFAHSFLSLTPNAHKRRHGKQARTRACAMKNSLSLSLSLSLSKKQKFQNKNTKRQKKTKKVELIGCTKRRGLFFFFG